MADPVQELAQALWSKFDDAEIPDNWGLALVVYDRKKGGTVVYLSTESTRANMAVLLRGLIHELEPKGEE